MAKIIKAADWEGDFLNIYEQIERKDLSPNAIEHKWIPHGVAKQGTSLNANFLNEIQKNSIYGILETNYKVTDNIDKYTIINFEGIGDTGVFKELKIKVLITNTNKYDSPKIVINSKEYSILYSVKSGIQNLKKELFVENQIYNMTYNGVGFIIENGNFKATENELGTLTLNDVRKENSYLSGSSYDGIFGESLTSIITGNNYLYLDLDGKGTLYHAITTKNNPSGFLVPNSTDFNVITNKNLFDKSCIASTNSIKFENGLFLQMFSSTAGGKNISRTNTFPTAFISTPTIIVATHYGFVSEGTNVAIAATSSTTFTAASPYETNIAISVFAWGRWK